MLAYAGWQALPARRTDPRQRRVGWLVAATMLLNAAWILTIQADRLALSVAVIVVLLVLLVAVFAGLLARPSSGWLETIVLDGTVGLNLGWSAWPRSRTPPRRCWTPGTPTSAWAWKGVAGGVEGLAGCRRRTGVPNRT